MEIPGMSTESAVRQAAWRPGWLAVFSPVPAEVGECTQSESKDSNGTQIRLVLGDRETGRRVITATYDRSGRTVSVTDLVLLNGGDLQECARASMGAEARGNGTMWRTQGSHHSPRTLHESERMALLTLAQVLHRRVAGGAG